MTENLPRLEYYLAKNPKTSHLDVLIFDLCGNAIGKRLPRSAMESMFVKGTPVGAAMQLLDVMGNTADPRGYGFSDGDPDAYACPIANTLVPIPWLQGNKSQVLCEFISATDNQPLWFEPRLILQKALERFSQSGFKPRLAVELEFYLISAKRQADGSPTPAVSPRTGLADDGGKVLSLDKLDEFDEVLSAIEAACKLQNIPTTSMTSEYGTGQFEVNLQHQDDVLQAADHAVLLRRAIQGVSRSLGYDATFMSKPFSGQTGNGMHIHLSLIDEDGNNIFDSDSQHGEKYLARAVAGMQAGMAESMAIFAPNINAYRRFKADEFVPVTRDWGENNRSVAFRIPPSDAKNRRIEHRVSGAEANPYLVIAAILAGVHYGLTEQLDPGEKHSGNAGSELDAALPLTLWSAMEAMHRSKILSNYIGEDYLDIYTRVKQAEFDAFMEGIHAREYVWYL
jgi:glutamine synthetase